MVNIIAAFFVFCFFIFSMMIGLIISGKKVATACNHSKKSGAKNVSSCACND